uniref:SCAN box domain-containing protein n=1 Tax=Salvator merianae TaxID=96440 RepID=A0A8D0DHS3_SALMN
MARRKWRRAFGAQRKSSSKQKVKKGTDAKEQAGMSDPQTELSVEGSLEGPPTKQAKGVSTLPDAPKELQESQPKPDESVDQPWETEFQEFLENSVWEEQLLEEQSAWVDMKTFLASFEQVAVVCRWPRREWVTRLLPALNEEAEKAFVSMDPEDRGDFRKVKAAILHWEAVAREKKHQEFRRFCYQEADGPREVYARLQDLCSQWLNVEKSTKEHILEMLIMEQFLNILPKEMQSWVKEQVPESSAQAIKLAEEFLKKLQAAERREQQEPQEVSSAISKTWKPPL